ncbi:hypothetical protein ABIA95_003083 [Bradyrhizobium sp. LA8.1]
MRWIVGLWLIVASSVAAGADSPIRGDYDWIAECVFLKLDPLSPGNVRFADLRSHGTAMVTLDIPAGAGTMRNVKAVLARAGDGLTAVNLEGSVGGHFTNKARELVAECSAEAPAPRRIETRPPAKGVTR